jgi:hypothetical protein
MTPAARPGAARRPRGPRSRSWFNDTRALTFALKAARPRKSGTSRRSRRRVTATRRSAADRGRRSQPPTGPSPPPPGALVQGPRRAASSTCRSRSRQYRSLRSDRRRSRRARHRFSTCRTTTASFSVTVVSTTPASRPGPRGPAQQSAPARARQPLRANRPWSSRNRFSDSRPLGAGARRPLARDRLRRLAFNTAPILPKAQARESSWPVT